MAKKRTADTQLDMFGAPASAPPRNEPLGLAPSVGELRALADRLPRSLRLGTSSWSFPGWEGFVWDRKVSTDRLAKDGLAVYARHPLFRSVGLDRTYYAPISAEAFANYAAQVPADFRFLVKAAEALTMPRFPHHPRYGAQKGMENPRFLDASWARDEVVAPFVEGLGEKGGPLIFQFSPLNLNVVDGASAFIERLTGFISALPKGPLYGVEVRNTELVTRELGVALKQAGAVPVVTGWADLPNVARQAEALGALEGEAFVLRWMLAPGKRYEGAYDEFEPFNALALPDPSTRELIVRLTRAAVGKSKPAWVIVNNKAEGSSPLSIIELVRAYLTEEPP